jgi:hypothetical protein
MLDASDTRINEEESLILADRSPVETRGWRGGCGQFSRPFTSVSAAGGIPPLLQHGFARAAAPGLSLIEVQVMSIEDRIEGKNPKRVLPQWNRQVLIQKQRMRAALLGAAIFGVAGISGFFVAAIPRWLQVFLFSCLPFLPIGLLQFYLDRRLYLARKADVAALEKLIRERKGDADCGGNE